MNRVIETEWWCIDLPDEWQVEEEDGTLVITDLDEISTVEISALKKEQGLISEQELKSFAEELIAQELPCKAISCGDFSGIVFDYVDPEGAWREWFLAASDLVLFISYSCDEQHQGLDDQAVDSILATLTKNEVLE